MWKRLIVAVMVSVGLTGFAPVPFPDLDRQKKSEEEMARLQGNWKVEEYSESGVSFVAANPSRLRVHRDQWSVTLTGAAPVNGQVELALGRIALRSGSYAMPESTRAFRFALEPKEGAGRIDLIEQSGKQKVRRGIYKLEGDVLTVCYRETDGAARPASFDDREGRTVLLKLRRVR